MYVFSGTSSLFISILHVYGNVLYILTIAILASRAIWSGSIPRPITIPDWVTLMSPKIKVNIRIKTVFIMYLRH